MSNIHFGVGFELMDVTIPAVSSKFTKQMRGNLRSRSIVELGGS